MGINHVMNTGISECNRLHNFFPFTTSFKQNKTKIRFC